MVACAPEDCDNDRLYQTICSLACRGNHTETIDLEFDPSVISYEDLLELFWRNHSATFEKSAQYMSAIFCHGEEQMTSAQHSKEIEEKEKKTKGKIYTKLFTAQRFYDAEE